MPKLVLSAQGLFKAGQKTFFLPSFFKGMENEKTCHGFNYPASVTQSYDHTTSVRGTAPGPCLFWLHSRDRESLADFRLEVILTFSKVLRYL